MKPDTPTTQNKAPDGLENAYRLPFEKLSLSKLPATPGVYVIRNAEDKIIYVGKAKNLRRRVTSYFRSDLSPKTRSMVGNAHSFSFVTAGHEDQALVLEANFIKRYRPHFNIQLIDGKTYPLIELTSELFPILRKTRRVANAKSRYFGPYPKAGLLNIGMNSLRRAFPVRTCHRCIDEAVPTKPCLDFDLGLCLGPCGNKCSPEEYRQAVHNLEAFLGGKVRVLLRQLESAMRQASREQQYEKAARCRDSYVALKSLFERYAVFSPHTRDMDIFAFRQNGNLVAVVRQALREGRLIASTEFIYDLRGKESLDAMMQADLIIDFYSRFHVDPPRRMAVGSTGSTTVLRRRLEEALGSSISLASPRTPETARLLRFAAENAAEKLVAFAKASDTAEQLAVIKSVLDLKHLPVRIEGYDVSNISGKDATVSMVVFRSGRPAKDQYRLFNIRSLDTPNDPAMLAEALARRFAHWHDIAFAEPADLLLIDGGLSQLAAVCKARDAAGVRVPVVGIAKKEELLYRENTREPVRLSHESGALLLLMAVRDEAHRFGKKEFHKRHEDRLRHE